jgi:formate hydrogenlyase subunit 3/multisubunit Na+/H+ antiporter MnhD subunit
VRTDAVTGSARAGGVYLGFALFGETLLLLGLVMLAAGTPGGGLSIADAVAALPGSPWRDAAIGLLVVGLGAKIGLVPLHSWMPLSYRAAPAAAAAVLSGAASKAGIIALLRFLPLGAALPFWGGAMVVLGLVSAFHGVVVGLTQRHPKTILAYSSISQFGLMTAALGMVLAAGDADGAYAVAFYAAHHVLAKGALFLAVGVAARRSDRPDWPVLLPATVVALGIAGLPLSGGAVAKLVLKPALGYGVVGTLAMLSAAGSTLLMLHFLRQVARRARVRPIAAAARLAWLGITLAAILVPWALSPVPAAAMLNSAALWDAAWPLLLGGALAAALHRWRPPAVPPGDVIVLGPALRALGSRLAAMTASVDSTFRTWPAATISVLLLAALLWVAALAAP